MSLDVCSVFPHSFPALSFQFPKSILKPLFSFPACFFYHPFNLCPFLLLCASPLHLHFPCIQVNPYLLPQSTEKQKAPLISPIKAFFIPRIVTFIVSCPRTFVYFCLTGFDFKPIVIFGALTSAGFRSSPAARPRLKPLCKSYITTVVWEQL